MIHHTNTTCPRCGLRHTPYDDEECADLLCDQTTALTRERDEARAEMSVVAEQLTLFVHAITHNAHLRR